MTDYVTCKVCDCVSPLGTVECPDCGAPLPTEPDPVPEAPPVEEATSQSDEEPKQEPPKRRWLRITAAALALCLLLGVAAALLRPKKEPAPGAYLYGTTFITPYGVWDGEEESLVLWGSTADSRYWLLWDSGQTVKSRILYSGAYSWSDSSTYGEGDYYLFDGRTLEPVDWSTPQLTDNGVAFYLEKGEDGLRLCRRDLKTGKISTLDKAPALVINIVAEDGTAAVYTKYPTDPVEPGEEGERFLWAAGKGVRPFDCPGDIPWALSSGGESCIYDVSWNWHYAVWRDGESYDLPMEAIYNLRNADLTEFVYQSYANEELGAWYYCTPGEDPIPLDLPENSHLEPVTPATERDYYYRTPTPDTMRGKFYRVYNITNQKGTALYYLDNDLNFTKIAGEIAYGEMYADPAGRQVVYLSNGSLYRASADKNDTVAVYPITDTERVEQDVRNAVHSFAVSRDLEHIYYLQPDDAGFYREANLYHWHDGKVTDMDFEMNVNYGYGIALQVAPNGACYILYTRDLYYTKGSEPPKLVLDDTGYASLVAVGPGKVPVLAGARWEDGANRPVYWLLDGDKEPEELTDWHPEEGKL